MLQSLQTLTTSSPARLRNRSLNNRFVRLSLVVAIAGGLSFGLPAVGLRGEPPRTQPIRGKLIKGNGTTSGNTQVGKPAQGGRPTTGKPLGGGPPDRPQSGNRPLMPGNRVPTPAKPPGELGLQQPAVNTKPQIPANKIERTGLPADKDKNSAGPINVATDEERNQVIAPDWKDPWAVFYITGKQAGYIEPCGCTGIENQKGGLMRRDSLLGVLQKRGWPVIPIDSGNQVRSDLFGKQSEIKYDWTAKALALMGYAATTYGESDLNLTEDALLYPLINAPTGTDGKPDPLFISANVSIFSELDTLYKVIQVGSRKVGITGVLGDENASKIQQNHQGITIKPALESLREVSKKLKAEKCDFLILIAQASLEESRTLAKEVPEFQLIITAGGYGEPTYRPEAIEGTPSQMVQVGVKGMYAGIVGLFDNEKEPLRYQRLALSSQFEDSPRMTELFGKYQDQLKAEGLERLGLRPVSHPTGREFVGSEKCGECHTTAFDIWKNTPHAHATDSIVDPPQRPIPRHFDPECLSCHTTGWNPQKFYPYKTGFETLEHSQSVVANGCENCHGPGKNHVDAETGDVEADKETLAKLRQEMQLPLAKAQDKCLECHDVDNSPEFHKDGAFEKYWEKVKHYGKD